MLQQHITPRGICIEYQQSSLEYSNNLDLIAEKLNTQRGALFASSYEYPGRYTCWDIGFFNPPLALVVKSEGGFLEALNGRGEQILAIILKLAKNSELFYLENITTKICKIHLKATTAIFNEESRSQQASVFSIIRELIKIFKIETDAYLGLYGAFGYDLIFQFENFLQDKKRESTQRDMLVYLPDEIYVLNHRKEEAFIRRYDFIFEEYSTKGLERSGIIIKLSDSKNQPLKDCDHEKREYAKLVAKAKNEFACGNLFEVVPSQTFYTKTLEKPAEIFKNLRLKNPSPYGFFINLGEEEFLVGASPEMYVRVQGKMIETCPISGTIKRGSDAIEDAENIQKLLESTKDYTELTMCTDVDRNDKSRICEAGSVKVIGRRQIEMYSRLIHTVDHVQGKLREGFDAVDAFLTHMWVVTVTGAPKLWAMKFIEKHEKSPRLWYAGAVGWFGFDGNLNTGLVLRTIRLKENIAEIRVGATLLYDSIPEEEEAETRLKASAFLDILNAKDPVPNKIASLGSRARGKSILLVDHQDSFVHTLANYFRQTGADVETIRSEHASLQLKTKRYDLVVLSPGPGMPKDFNLSETISQVLEQGIPLFGVCLGLQGIVEYFGGKLETLTYPMHGKASQIYIKEADPLFVDLGSSFTAGRYHSLYASKVNFPLNLRILASTEDDIIMAIKHENLPIYALQFHPETILSLKNEAGLKIIHNLTNLLF